MLTYVDPKGAWDDAISGPSHYRKARSPVPSSRAQGPTTSTLLACISENNEQYPPSRVATGAALGQGLHQAVKVGLHKEGCAVALPAACGHHAVHGRPVAAVGPPVCRPFVYRFVLHTYDSCPGQGWDTSGSSPTHADVCVCLQTLLLCESAPSAGAHGKAEQHTLPALARATVYSRP